MGLTKQRAWTHRGNKVVDVNGEDVGLVKDVWPVDGGGDAEMVLVECGKRFKRLRYLPLDDRTPVEDGVMRVSWTRTEIDDAPSAEDQRWGDPALVARAYWRDSAD